MELQNKKMFEDEEYTELIGEFFPRSDYTRKYEYTIISNDE